MKEWFIIIGGIIVVLCLLFTIFKYVDMSFKCDSVSITKQDKPSPYTKNHKFQWYISGICNNELNCYAIKYEFIDRETYNCIFKCPFRFTILESYDNNMSIKYSVSICYLNDDNQSDWPMAFYIAANIFNNKIDMHEEFIKVVKQVSNIDEDIIYNILENIQFHLKNNILGEIVKSVERAFLIITCNLIPEKFIKALEDNYSTIKLNDEIITSIANCVNSYSIYYDMCKGRGGSSKQIDGIGAKLEAIIKNKITTRKLDSINYIVCNRSIES